jgi:hypothetical protein
MIFDIRIEAEGAIQLFVAIQRAYDPLSLRTWAETKARPYASQAFEQNFQTRGGRLGKYWAGLAESTQKQRTRLGFGARTPTLVRTGNLEKAVVEHRPIIKTYPELEIEWGSNVNGGHGRLSNDALYGIHQMGRGFNPARPMVGFNSIDAKHLTLSLYGWIGRQIQLGHINK